MNAPANTVPVPFAASQTDASLGALEQEVCALFVEYRAPLLRYVLSLGLTVGDGEDIIQETFLALYQHLRADKPRTNLRGWIFRVGHNQALRVRARGRHTISLESEEIDARPHPHDSPEELAAGSQMERRVAAVINALAIQDRACLTLRGEGLRYREIAETLGISLGAVALSLARSLGKLERVCGTRVDRLEKVGR